MEKIKVHCFTNLDDWRRKKWPSELQYLPRIGERVAAEDGCNLRVVMITHSEKGIKIELHN